MGWRRMTRSERMVERNIRDHALLNGLAKYTSILPCERCDTSERYALTFTCVECSLERQAKRWRSPAVQKKWQNRGPEVKAARAAASREWRRANPDKAKAKERQAIARRAAKAAAA